MRPARVPEPSSEAPAVHAAVVGPSGSELETTREAVSGETGAAREHATWHAAVTAAVATERRWEWLWLVEAGVVPRPGALAELLAPFGPDGAPPAPALLTCRVLGRDGALDPASMPWPPLLDRELAMTAGEHRLAALRLARWGALLVRRDAAERHGPPRRDFAGGADDLEWTGRILREQPGYLVPGSVAVRVTEQRRQPVRVARDRVRMLAGARWNGPERAWWAYRLAADAAARLSARERA